MTNDGVLPDPILPQFCLFVYGTVNSNGTILSKVLTLTRAPRKLWPSYLDRENESAGLILTTPTSVYNSLRTAIWRDRAWNFWRNG